MSYTLDPLQTNCYPGTTVLINKLDIRDEWVLSQVEAGLYCFPMNPISSQADFLQGNSK